MQKSQRYFLQKPSYSRFCLKFHCHGNRGHPEVNLNGAVKLAVPKNHSLEPNMKWIGWPVSEISPFETFQMRRRSLVIGRSSIYTCLHGSRIILFATLGMQHTRSKPDRQWRSSSFQDWDLRPACSCLILSLIKTYYMFPCKSCQEWLNKSPKLVGQTL